MEGSKLRELTEEEKALLSDYNLDDMTLVEQHNLLAIKRIRNSRPAPRGGKGRSRKSRKTMRSRKSRKSRKSKHHRRKRTMRYFF